MYKEKLITKVEGLKSEHCALIAHAASRFKSDISIIKGNKKVNAKSIMGLLSLNIKNKDLVFINISGDDEVIAMDEILGLL
ncbi:MAG: HPr family phosphocarrier protein [Christensenellaceae bacterium]|jgi:phosphotransferase system HPr (HPr) family protein|nr:HPr family phosphocarrier protein [Christensenellaceae bacterium]